MSARSSISPNKWYVQKKNIYICIYLNIYVYIFESLDGGG